METFSLKSFTFCFFYPVYFLFYFNFSLLSLSHSCIEGFTSFFISVSFDITESAASASSNRKKIAKELKNWNDIREEARPTSHACSLAVNERHFLFATNCGLNPSVSVLCVYIYVCVHHTAVLFDVTSRLLGLWDPPPPAFSTAARRDFPHRSDRVETSGPCLLSFPLAMNKNGENENIKSYTRRRRRV